MGYERHHAIVVTGWNQDQVLDAWTKATETFDTRAVSTIVSGSVNSQFTFMVGPDGSKEGWAESLAGDEQRDEYVRWLTASSSFVEWVELIIGGDDDQPAITAWGNWSTTPEGIAERAEG